MNISLNWLKQYIDLDLKLDDLTHQMTMLGMEIESVQQPGDEIKDVYVGQIISIESHPDADKLVVCKTDVGRDEPAQIVCGAKNMSVGDKVPTAVIGATLPGGFKIARRKMRGIESQGMMCSASELGLAEESEGLLILDTDMAVGADAKALLGLDDVILEIEVIPNRGDWASMIGVARELAAIYQKELRLPEVKLTEAEKAASDYASITIEAPDLCPRYIGRVLTDVTVKPSPLWLCQRLIAAGQRPINNIVDITNYVLMETGHPLHAFDLNLLAENRIVARRARKDEKMTTLDGEARTLNEDMLVIADAKVPQAVAGIMGGGDSEVGETTTTILLESAVFNSASIRATSRGLGLISESSQRFQRGADPEMAQFAIDRAAMLMQELAGASVARGRLDAYPAPAEAATVTLRYARTNQLLGADIPAQTQKDNLSLLGFQITEETDEQFTVKVPSWRHDVSMEADLIEEVARLYGYDNIAVALPRVRPREEIFAPHDRIIRKLRRFLVAQGLTEVVHWTFSNEEDVRKAGMDEDYFNMVGLQNPLSEKQATMRSSLIPTLLNNTANNINHGASALATFEIGPVFVPRAGEELPDERSTLAIAMSGTAGNKHWSSALANVDFYDIKGYAEAILEFFGCEGEYEAQDFGPLQGGQSARISIGKRAIGHFGKVKDSVLRSFDLENEVFLLEIDLKSLLKGHGKAAKFEIIPGFPASLRDMAVVVNADFPVGDLLKTAQKSGGKLLKSAELFDIYQGKQVPKGKKSVALSLTFRSAERTLTDKDTQKSWDKILKQLEKQHGATLR
jgi:phenylalanyl-tRNA synthetase beta chain